MCAQVCVGGVCICLVACGCLWNRKETEDWKWSDISTLFFFLSLFRLPEPRADPMDPRDFDDSDSGPSMDHAPWFQQTRLFLLSPVLQCLLQPCWAVRLALSLSAISFFTPAPLPSQCLLAVNRPWTRVLWQIWMAMSFLHSNFF